MIDKNFLALRGFTKPGSHTVLISAVALSKNGFDQLAQELVVSAETSKVGLAAAMINRMEN